MSQIKILSIVVAIFLLPPFVWGKILFKGISKKDISHLRKEFSFLNQSTITGFEIDQIIKYLMKNGKYENIYAFEEDLDRIIIKGRKVRKIQSVLFMGQKAFSQKKLFKVLNLSLGDRLSSLSIFEAKKNLIQFYKNEGYHNLKIQIKLERKRNFAVVKFILKEGKPSVIQSFVIQTNNVDLKKKIESKTKNLVGKIFNQDLSHFVRKKWKEFLKKEFFFSSILKEQVNYNKKKTEVHIQYIISDPYKYRFILKGNRHFSDVKLRKITRLSEANNLDFIFEIKKRIEEFYLKEGFAHMKLDHFVRENRKKYEREVVFHLQEGRRTRIEKIDVFGHLSRLSQFYADFIRKNSTKLVAKGFYVKKDIDFGYKNLVSYLKNTGYFKSQIYSSRVKFVGPKKKAYIFVFLNEGPLTKVRSVRFLGNKKFSSQTLSKLIKINKNAPLKKDKLMKSVENLKNFYQSQAYLEMKVLNEDSLVQYKREGGYLDIVFKIKEGPRIQVSYITLTGNKITDSQFILRNLKFKEGDFLTKTKIKNSIKMLSRTRLFSRVQIRTLEKGTNLSQRTVIVSLLENKPGIFRFSLGANNERALTLKGMTQLSYNNLFGTARILTGRVEGFWNFKEIRYPEHLLTLGYVEPLLLGLPIKGQMNVTRSDRAFDFKPEENLSIMQRSHQWESFLEYFLTPSLSLRWIVYNLISGRDFVFPKRELKDFDPSELNLASTGFRVHLNRLDHPFSPTKGLSSKFNFHYTSPLLGGSHSIEYIKAEARYTYYLRLGSPRWLFAHSIRGGYLKNISNKPESGIPASQIFILGGSTTIRGFQRGTERIPSKHEFKIQSGNDPAVTGKSYYYLGKFEFHFPFFNLLGGVLFYDLGGVVIFERKGKKERRIQFERTLRQALGLELRVKTPVAPLVGGIGCKPRRPLKGESQCHFHFSIGIL